MDIENMTLKDAVTLADRLGGGEVPPFEVDKKYLIRCVTHYWVGRIVKASTGWLVLEDASWVADTGRFSDALTKHELSEVEPVPGTTIVSCGAIVDAVQWTGDLPLVQK